MPADRATLRLGSERLCNPRHRSANRLASNFTIAADPDGRRGE